MPFFEPPVVYDNPPFLPTTRGRVLMYARHRALQPRGRTVLKISPPGDTVRYPLTTLFPDLDVYPQGPTDPPVYVTIDGPTVDQVNAATIAYLGGHIYYVDNDEAASLTAAGFTVTPDAADTAPPILKILAPAPYTNVTTTLTVTVSAPDAVILTGRISRGNAGLSFNFAPGSSSYTVPDIVNFGAGVYRIEVTAIDAVGNSSSAYVDVNLISASPVPPIDPPPIDPVAVLPSLTTLPSSELLP